MKKNILITGAPGVGKTTLIKKLFEEVKWLNPVGFYTAEIREGGIRKGFELVSFTGEKGLLSHINIKSPYRVSKYGVDVKGFENFLDALLLLRSPGSVIIIDEIGKMECFSEKFNSLLKEILDSQKLLIATISTKGNKFIEEVKKRKDVALFLVTIDNRESILGEILDYIKKII